MSRFAKGILAEFCVRQEYEARGFACIGERQRIGRTDIDLIFKKGTLTLFVEVKAAATHDAALARINAAQTKRLFEAAALFNEGEQGDIRIDVAAVNATGQVFCLENAFAGA